MSHHYPYWARPRVVSPSGRKNRICRKGLLLRIRVLSSHLGDRVDHERRGVDGSETRPCRSSIDARLQPSSPTPTCRPATYAAVAITSAASYRTTSRSRWMSGVDVGGRRGVAAVGSAAPGE